MSKLGLIVIALATIGYSQNAKAMANAYISNAQLPIKDMLTNAGGEKVKLSIYFIGFPTTTDPSSPFHQDNLKAAVIDKLNATTLVDNVRWDQPRKPTYGSGLYPPNDFCSVTGPLYNDPLFYTFTPATGMDLQNQVDAYYNENLLVNQVEHEGSFPETNPSPSPTPAQLLWHANTTNATFVFWPSTDPNYTALKSAVMSYNLPPLTLINPAVTYNLYSYNSLMDKLAEIVPQTPGGATLVFLNMPELNTENYTFYADPKKDLVQTAGNNAIELQFPSAQGDAAAINYALDGKGLNQVKMFAALDVKCASTTTAQAKGLLADPIKAPYFKADQTVCQTWAVNPITNLLPNKGRGIYVSDLTRTVKSQTLSPRTEILSPKLSQATFDLYRYGVVPPNIKAKHRFTEAYELRTLVFDLRYSGAELCYKDKLVDIEKLPVADQDSAKQQAEAFCLSTCSSGCTTEQTYTRSQVFDSELAKKSLAEFAPGTWQYRENVYDFGSDLSASYYKKKNIRDRLANPKVRLAGTSSTVTFPQTPLYRDLRVTNALGNLVSITSSFEKGLDFVETIKLFSGNSSEDPLMMTDNSSDAYSHYWGDTVLNNAAPYHESHLPRVMPLVLVLTPAPDGPLGEKWGTFYSNFTSMVNEGLVTDFGGGSLWLSVGGNEDNGGIMRRDYSLWSPYYVYGPNRGNDQNGDLGLILPAEIPGLVPAGTAYPKTVNIFRRSIEIGAPMWCNEFNTGATDQIGACRDFVKYTTTLQAIETMQHGLGYLHDPEPRKKYHYDGTLSSATEAYNQYDIARTYLTSVPYTDMQKDKAKLALHSLVNMYTTAGTSNLWSQSASDWNGVGLSTGMQNSLFRSHAREEIMAADSYLTDVINAFNNKLYPPECNADPCLSANNYISAANLNIGNAKDAYILNWNYRTAITESVNALSNIKKAFTVMGVNPSKPLYDPKNPVW